MCISTDDIAQARQAIKIMSQNCDRPSAGLSLGFFTGFVDKVERALVKSNNKETPIQLDNSRYKPILDHENSTDPI